jgi:hypothetical protein
MSSSLLSRPRAALRTTALALAVVAVAAGCGGGGDTAETTTTPPATTTTSPPTTTTLPATTTTELATTTTEAPAPVYPLTGLPETDPFVAARPALVVKIDNAPGARPQTGFNAADLVFEEIVNDNLTRFAMVFQSQGSDPVGPIRSGRLQDIDLFGMLNRPLFAWSGGNATVTKAIHNSDLVDVGPNRAAAYFRSKDRKAPHNLYATTSKLWEYSPPDAAPPQQLFEYRAAGEPATGTPSTGVDITLDSIDVTWVWDATNGVYLRTMEGSDHRDGAGGQVSTHNVVVLAVAYAPGISGSPDAQTIGTGEAFVFTGGTYIHATWTRADRLSPFVLTADDGSAVKLTPGRTFVELPRIGNTRPAAG